MVGGGGGGLLLNVFSDLLVDGPVSRELISSSSGKLSHSVHFQTGDTDEGPASKKNHQEESTSDSKKTELPTHNSIADTLLCSICQV